MKVGHRHFQRLWCHQRNIGIICIWPILSIIHSLWIYYLGHLGSHKTALCQWYQCMRSRGNVFLITYAKVHKGALFFQYGGAIPPDPSRVFKNNNIMATLPPKRNGIDLDGLGTFLQWLAMLKSTQSIFFLHISKIMKIFAQMAK